VTVHIAQGEFVQGVISGKGTFFYDPAAVDQKKCGYHGQVRDDDFGDGARARVCVCVRFTSHVSCQWLNGLPHGAGILYLRGGRKFTGDFRFGMSAMRSHSR
jgi:hypothetical protein